MVEQAEMNESPERAGEPAGDGDAADPDTLKEQIIEALKNVVDPELGINIVDLGLVYGLDIQGNSVHITYTLTTMGCPIGPLIEPEMRQQPLWASSEHTGKGPLRPGSAPLHNFYFADGILSKGGHRCPNSPILTCWSRRAGWRSALMIRT